MKTVWVLDHYSRQRHEEFALLNKDRYQTIRFMSAFVHNNPHAGANITRVEKTPYGKRILLKTFPYTANNWRRSINMVTFALQVIANTWRKPRPDLIVASGPHLFTLAAGAFAARLLKVELVIEIRDFWPRVLVELGGLKEGSFFTRIMFRLEKHCYQAAKRFIFVMPKGHKYLEEMGLVRDYTVIPNGITRELAHDTLEIRLPQRQLYPFLVFYTGLLGNATNPDVILDAARILERDYPGQFGFMVYGNGSHLERIYRRIQEENIDNVILHEPVSRREVLAILRTNADATLMTLTPAKVFKYGISLNKISDYLAVAKPIVNSGHAANDPVAEAGCGISVPPGDPAALAKALLKLYQMSPAERSLLGSRALSYLELHYLTNNHAASFADFICRDGSIKEADSC